MKNINSQDLCSKLQRLKIFWQIDKYHNELVLNTGEKGCWKQTLSVPL